MTSCCFPPPAITLTEVQHFHSYCLLGVRLHHLSQETTSPNPSAPLHYCCSPYLLPVALTARSATQLSGSPMLPACSPPGLCHAEVILHSTALTPSGGTSGLPLPPCSPRLSTCGIGLWWHRAMVASPLGVSRGVKVSKLFTESPLTSTVSFNRNNLSGD